MEEEITLSLKGVEKIIELIKEDIWDHPQAGLKEIALRFYNNPDFVFRTTDDDPALVVIDLIHEINDSGQMYAFIKYIKEKTGTKRFYDNIVEKYEVKKLTQSNKDDDSLNKTENNSEKEQSQEPKNELSAKLNQVCKDLIVNEKNWKKFRLHAIILAIVSVAVFVVGIQFIPEGKTINSAPEFAIPIIIGTFTALFFAGFKQGKAEKERRKNLGYNKLTLLSYRAYELIEKYDGEPDFNYIKKVNGNIESILNNLEIHWEG